MTIRVYESVEEIQTFISQEKAKGKSVGFTPTMGALHEGHMSLVRRSNRENDISVVSIFVNPTQFNEQTDLAKYPRTFKADKKLLDENNCDVLFFPSVKEIYPKGTGHRPKVKLKGLDQKLEGAFRPGHFDGVVQVVHRFLDIVKPNRLYMGQKDFQQFTIIDRMIEDLKMPVELVVCPIGRSNAGLALSSRNARLKRQHKERAVIIHQCLLWTKRHLESHTIEEIINYSMTRLAIQDFNPEYFLLVDGYSLSEVKNVNKHKYIVALTAVWAGEVRLIDNMIVKKV